MDLRQLEVFLTLADELHFGHTADRLHLTQPQVSRAVAALERHIGAPLFERTSRRVRLTPLGRRLRTEAEPAYRLLQDALRDARAEARQVGRNAARRIPAADRWRGPQPSDPRL